MKPAHEMKYCPRCLASFECKPGNVAQCQCFDVELSRGEKEFISARYDDCLCKNCLLDMKMEYARELHVRKLK
jgi:hypothetical protein